MLEQRIQSLADTMYNEGFLVYYESCSLESIGNSIHHFSHHQNKVLSKTLLSTTVTELKDEKQQQLAKINEMKLYKSGKYDFGFQMNGDKLMVNAMFERLSFFKPLVTFNAAGLINFEEDIRRIL